MALTISINVAPRAPKHQRGSEYLSSDYGEIIQKVGGAYINRRGWMVSDAEWFASQLYDPLEAPCRFRYRIPRLLGDPASAAILRIGYIKTPSSDWFLRASGTGFTTRIFEISPGASTWNYEQHIVGPFSFTSPSEVCELVLECVSCTLDPSYPPPTVRDVQFYLLSASTAPASLVGGYNDGAAIPDSQTYASGSQIDVASLGDTTTTAIRAFEWMPGNILTRGLRYSRPPSPHTFVPSAATLRFGNGVSREALDPTDPSDESTVYDLARFVVRKPEMTNFIKISIYQIAPSPVGREIQYAAKVRGADSSWTGWHNGSAGSWIDFLSDISAIPDQGEMDCEVFARYSPNFIGKPPSDPLYYVSAWFEPRNLF